MSKLDDRALNYVATYFKALAEPMRLKVLNALQDGEKNVSELTEIAESTQANVSKHLSILSLHRIVKRESRGNCVYYSIVDQDIYQLCQLVCGQIGKQMNIEAEVKNAFLVATQNNI